MDHNRLRVKANINVEQLRDRFNKESKLQIANCTLVVSPVFVIIEIELKTLFDEKHFDSVFVMVSIATIYLFFPVFSGDQD